MSDGADVNKTNILREYIICHDWYLLQINYRFQYTLVVLMKIIIIITIKSFWKIVHVNNINMLYYGRIYVSEGVDANTSSTYRGCIIICH